jgi:sirohydrochlorin ferrochelatase
MQQVPDHVGVIIVDHGSRKQEANQMLEKVAALYREMSGHALVEAAHMELAEPSIAQAFEKCVARGATRIVVHPYFLAPGRHVTQDIPELAAEAAAQFPGVHHTVTNPLGIDARMAAIMHDRITASLEGATVTPGN